MGAQTPWYDWAIFEGLVPWIGAVVLAAIGSGAGWFWRKGKRVSSPEVHAPAPSTSASDLEDAQVEDADREPLAISRSGLVLEEWPRPDGSKPVVFISFSYVDYDMVVADQLSVLLKQLPDEVEIFFSKESLKPGDLITPEIKDALSRTICGVLLLSQDFIDPDRYARTIELPELVDRWTSRRADLIPLVCRDAPFEDVPELQGRLAVNDLNEPLQRFGRDSEQRTRVLNITYRHVRKSVTDRAVNYAARVGGAVSYPVGRP